MADSEKLIDYISDVWKEIDYFIVQCKSDDAEMFRMNILGIMQHQADVFEISREMLGLPVTDADELFLRR